MLAIDLDPQAGLDRALSRKGSEERFESFGTDLQTRMRAGFLALAGDFPDRITVIDGARAPEQVAQDILGVVTSRLR